MPWQPSLYEPHDAPSDEHVLGVHDLQTLVVLSQISPGVHGEPQEILPPQPSDHVPHDAASEEHVFGVHVVHVFVLLSQTRPAAQGH